MMEVLSESVRLVNLPFTVLLGCVVLYWLLMALGLFNFDTGADVDTDVDVDAHVDAHVDAADMDAHLDGHVDADGDTDVHAHAEPGFLGSVLQFLNIGEVPLMVVLSIMALCGWILSVGMNHYWNDGTVLRVMMLLAVNLVATCIVTHFAARPFKALFKALNREYEEHTPIIGRTCIITTSEANAQFGQAEIKTKGAPILINVRTTEDVTLRKGETGLVIKEDKQKGTYAVIKVTAENLEA